MKEPSRTNVDVAALRALQMVHERRSFTATATALDVNQSAVSYTIDKLRRVFGDPLFFRQGGKIVPTERCNAIVASVDSILEQFEVLLEPENFDPATADQAVTIACNYYERQVIMPLLVGQLRRLAPGIRVTLINSTFEGDAQLKRSEADLLIGPLRPDLQDFYCSKLLDEHYVCVMDPTNPLTKAPLTLADYVLCPHVTITYGGTWRSRYLTELANQRLSLNQVLSIPSPACLAETVTGTDLIATVPSRIAAAHKHRLHIADCPLPAPFEVDLVWTTRTHHGPMHMWLRKLISRTVREQLVEP